MLKTADCREIYTGNKSKNFWFLQWFCFGSSHPRAFNRNLYAVVSWRGRTPTILWCCHCNTLTSCACPCSSLCPFFIEKNKASIITMSTVLIRDAMCWYSFIFECTLIQDQTAKKIKAIENIMLIHKKLYHKLILVSISRVLSEHHHIHHKLIQIEWVDQSKHLLHPMLMLSICQYQFEYQYQQILKKIIIHIAQSSVHIWRVYWVRFTFCTSIDNIDNIFETFNSWYYCIN